MKGSSILNAVSQLLLIALIANVSQIKALTPEQTCPLVKNNTYVGDPTDCQGWAFCRDGKAFYGKCENDQYFNSALGICDYKQNVACNNNVETMCEGLTDIYKADPGDCSKYCYCKDGVTRCNKCPAGQYFEPNSVKCVWQSTSSCMANSPCILAPDGFIAVTGSCTGYVRCASSQVIASGNCPDGLYYNPQKAICDNPEDVNCSGTPSPSPGPPTPSVPIPPKDLCKNDNMFYNVPDAEGCRSYFYCERKGSTGVWGECPKNSQFSEEKQQCLDPDEVVCTKDRCDGTSKSFMAVANTKCMKYYNCNKGVQTGQGSCPKDHPYYNELSGFCQTEKLNYKICA